MWKRIRNFNNNNKTRKLHTSETCFTLAWDCWAAHADPHYNTIEIGTQLLTMETLVHEISELVVHEILTKDFNVVNKRIGLKIDGDVSIHFLSHFLAPYGHDSLIYPSKSNRKPENEEWLIPPEDAVATKACGLAKRGA